MRLLLGCCCCCCTRAHPPSTQAGRQIKKSFYFFLFPSSLLWELSLTGSCSRTFVPPAQSPLSMAVWLWGFDGWCPARTAAGSSRALARSLNRGGRQQRFVCPPCSFSSTHSCLPANTRAAPEPEFFLLPAYQRQDAGLQQELIAHAPAAAAGSYREKTYLMYEG